MKTGDISARILPSSCLLLAIQAWRQIRDCVTWCAILQYSIPSIGSGHAVLVFEGPDGRLWSYQSDGSMRLAGKERNATKLAREIQSLNHGGRPTHAHFVVTTTWSPHV